MHLFACRLPRVFILCFVLILACGARVALAADPLIDLPVLKPGLTERLKVTVQNGASTIGGTANVLGPQLELCNSAKTLCTTGYPGMAVQLPVDGRLNFRIEDKLPAFPITMSHCMDSSNWDDAHGWRSDYGLMNFHTHGLLVKPYVSKGANPGLNRYGDYVFDCATGAVGYAASASSHIIGKTITYSNNLNEENVSLGIDQGQPYGLNWFHPHVHGIAKAQVSLGMAGMLLLGDPLKNLCLSVNASMTSCNKSESDALLAKTQMRNILLKDAQLVHTGGASGKWYNNADQDPTFCQGHENEPGNIGACVPMDLAALKTPDMTKPGPVKIGGSVQVDDARWAFTLNGQQYPQIDFDTAHPYQLLRIQNASANITYKLSLRPSTSDTVVAPMPANPPAFQILSLDGAGYVGGGFGNKHVQTAKEILLMPGSRAELLVDAGLLCPLPCATAATYQLVTDGYQAGFAHDDADNWPQIALAKLVVPASAPPLMAYTNAPVQMRTMARMIQRNQVPAQKIAENCRLYGKSATDYAIRLKNGDKRRLYFGISEDGNDFALGATILHSDGTESELTGDPITRANPPRLHVMNMDDDLVDICVQLGQGEIWQLVNISSEVHNFHIHQVKFRVARDGVNPLWRIQSPYDDQTLRDDIVFTQGESELEHDTIVVPRGRSECKNSLVKATPRAGEPAETYVLSYASSTVPVDPANPSSTPVAGTCDGSGQVVTAPAPGGLPPYADLSGMIEVVIPFSGTQLDMGSGKPAKFVYHCHILEHEDKGMMSSIAVLPVN